MPIEGTGILNSNIRVITTYRSLSDFSSAIPLKNGIHSFSSSLLGPDLDTDSNQPFPRVTILRRAKPDQESGIPIFPCSIKDQPVPDKFFPGKYYLSLPLSSPLGGRE
jgi:hypothetical protein